MTTWLDITDEVDFRLNDDECLPLTRCACGQRFPPWKFTLGVYPEYPTTCPLCGRRMYFTIGIRVHQIVDVGGGSTPGD